MRLAGLRGISECVAMNEGLVEVNHAYKKTLAAQVQLPKIRAGMYKYESTKYYLVPRTSYLVPRMYYCVCVSVCVVRGTSTCLYACVQVCWRGLLLPRRVGGWWRVEGGRLTGDWLLMITTCTYVPCTMYT